MNDLFNIKAKLVEANLLNEYISPNTVLGISHYNWQLLRYYKILQKDPKIKQNTDNNNTKTIDE